MYEGYGVGVYKGSVGCIQGECGVSVSKESTG